MNKIEEIIDKYDQQQGGFGGWLSDSSRLIKKMMIEYADWYAQKCIHKIGLECDLLSIADPCYGIDFDFVSQIELPDHTE